MCRKNEKNMKTLMILEDEELVRQELKLFLEKNGFQVIAPDYLPTEEEIISIHLDLLLLDIGLGEADGIVLCRKLRQKTGIPIIFVTSQEMVQKEIEGLKAGGNDYIRKPFHFPVLLLRIQKHLERIGETLTVEQVTLDLVFGQLSYKGEVYDLSKKEQQILFYLFKNYPRLMEREELISCLWENKLFVDENILNVNLSRIRKRLEGTPLENFIRTIPKKGYGVGWDKK